MARSQSPGFADENVKAAFDAHAVPVRRRLLQLRQLIFNTAGTTDGVGQISESLKWGQPSYAPVRHCFGTSVRIDALQKSPGDCAMFFHCQTTMIGDVRQIYPDVFRFDGNRALIFEAGADLPEAELKHCIALALTYHQRRR